MNKSAQCVLLCLVCLLLASCSSELSTGKSDLIQQSIGQEAEDSARLTESQVLSLADECTKENKRDIDLADYPDRRPRYKSDSQSWSVLYHRVPNHWPGDHFMVVVDDQTKQVRLIAGR